LSALGKSYDAYNTHSKLDKLPDGAVIVFLWCIQHPLQVGQITWWSCYCFPMMHTTSTPVWTNYLMELLLFSYDAYNIHSRLDKLPDGAVIAFLWCIQHPLQVGQITWWSCYFFVFLAHADMCLLILWISECECIHEYVNEWWRKWMNDACNCMTRNLHIPFIIHLSIARICNTRTHTVSCMCTSCITRTPVRILRNILRFLRNSSLPTLPSLPPCRALGSWLSSANCLTRLPQRLSKPGKELL